MTSASFILESTESYSKSYSYITIKSYSKTMTFLLKREQFATVSSKRWRLTNWQDGYTDVQRDFNSTFIFVPKESLGLWKT